MTKIRQDYMFHGDIKPANIFYDGDKGISSDSGTLTKLDKNDPNKKYYI